MLNEWFSYFFTAFGLLSNRVIFLAINAVYVILLETSQKFSLIVRMIALKRRFAPSLGQMRGLHYNLLCTFLLL